MKKTLLTLLMLIFPLIAYATCPGGVTCIEISTPGTNIGIGSSSPGQTLDVNGTVRAIAFTGPSVGPIVQNPSSGYNVGVGSLSPGATLDVNGTVRQTGFILTTGVTTGYVLTTNSLGVGTWAVASAGLSGLTTNNVPYATSSSALGASNITNLGSNVGIGSTTPGQVLDVNGTVRGSALIAAGSGYTVFDGGNIGIGTTIDNAGVLQFDKGTNSSGVGEALALCSSSSGYCLGYCTAGTYPACSSCTCVVK